LNTTSAMDSKPNIPISHINFFFIFLLPDPFLYEKGSLELLLPEWSQAVVHQKQSQKCKECCRVNGHG
jgi:hypothetical protein